MINKISGGQNVGAMKEVGKARRQYSSAYGDIVPIIGILNWKEILYKENLLNLPGSEKPKNVHMRYAGKHLGQTTNFYAIFFIFKRQWSWGIKGYLLFTPVMTQKNEIYIF